MAASFWKKPGVRRVERRLFGRGVEKPLLGKDIPRLLGLLGKVVSVFSVVSNSGLPAWSDERFESTNASTTPEGSWFAGPLGGTPAWNLDLNRAEST